MNRLITFLLLCFTVSTVIAQENAQIKVEYTERYKNWTGANKKEKMILLANGDISHYYNPMTLVVDSMLSTPKELFSSTVWLKQQMQQDRDRLCSLVQEHTLLKILVKEKQRIMEKPLENSVTTKKTWTNKTGKPPIQH